MGPSCLWISHYNRVLNKTTPSFSRLVLQIRKTTAGQMYEMLLTYDDVIDPEVVDDVMTLLSDTNWSVVMLVFGAIALLFLCTCVRCLSLHCHAGCPLQGKRHRHGTDPQESAL